jgi:hypothetical protein
MIQTRVIKHKEKQKKPKIYTRQPKTDSSIQSRELTCTIPAKEVIVEEEARGCEVQAAEVEEEAPIIRLR